MGKCVVSASVLKWGEGLRNRVPNIINIYIYIYIHIGNMMFAVYIAVSFIKLFLYFFGSIFISLYKL